MPIQKSNNSAKPTKNSGSAGKITAKSKSGTRTRGVVTQQKSGNSLAKKEDVAFSSESKDYLKGTDKMDMMNPTGAMPNLLEAFGGDDIIKMKGHGKSEVRAGDGDDIIDFGGKPDGKEHHDTKIDGGKGNDAVYAGSDTAASRPFHITDEKGRTVAKNGEGGDKAQIQNVESAIVSNTVYGGDGDDKITSDFQGNSDVKLVETHNIDGGKGNDDITIRSGDKGTSEANILPKEGDNKVKYEGGAADDRVWYGSHRGADGEAAGSDQVNLSGGEGNDQLAISSQNYSLVDKEGKVLSKLGAGADKISVDGFEKIWVNGEALDF